MKSRDMYIFRAVCFAVLMQGNGGIMNKSPAYIWEKFRAIEDCCSAYAMLDENNQQKVREWATRWHFPIDDIIAGMI